MSGNVTEAAEEVLDGESPAEIVAREGNDEDEPLGDPEAFDRFAEDLAEVDL